MTRQRPMAICPNCRHQMSSDRKDYLYKESGLDNVVLKNIRVFHCQNCGDEMADLPHVKALHQEIVSALLKKKDLLCGQEVRFLRKMARLQSKQLARVLQKDPPYVSRIESESRKQAATVDRLIRIACAIRIHQIHGSEASAEFLKQVSQELDSEIGEDRVPLPVEISEPEVSQSAAIH